MKSKFASYMLRVSLLLLMAMLLSGCWIRLLIGNTVVENDVSDRVDLLFTSLKADSTIAICSSGDEYISANCTYIIDGTNETSTVQLVSELGLAGLIIDPLVFQIPEDSSQIQATYNDGSGARPALVSVVSSFEYVPGEKITAEAGTKFVIVELPESETSKITATDPKQGQSYQFAIDFEQRVPSNAPRQPLQVKAMLTARVEVNGHVYYAPLLPCVTSFAAIPSLTIPETTQAADLLQPIEDLVGGGAVKPCANAFYDYSGAPPPLSPVLYLPVLER